jgi:hypothetical protein
MKINLVEVEASMVKSFTMFADPDIKLLMETKTVRVTPYNITKTRISTDIQFGQYCVKINKPIDGFKTYKSIDWNYISGKQTTSHYFVKSKKQNIEAYKEYVKQVVETVIKDYFNLELDELTIELEKGGF